jgi:hypothetical protein
VTDDFLPFFAAKPANPMGLVVKSKESGQNIPE